MANTNKQRYRRFKRHRGSVTHGSEDNRMRFGEEFQVPEAYVDRTDYRMRFGKEFQAVDDYINLDNFEQQETIARIVGNLDPGE